MSGLRKSTMRKWMILCVVILVCTPGLYGCNNEDPVVRPGSGFDGSVKWALQLAQLEIDNFAADADLYTILGALVWMDGRLPANSGTWSFVTWSQSLKQQLQVTVRYDGNVTRSVTDKESPPSTGSGGPLPAGWVNSTDIFSAIPSQEIARSFAQLVVFNITSYPQAPNTALWVMNFAGGNNPIVRWDGVYIGTQSD